MCIFRDKGGIGGYMMIQEKMAKQELCERQMDLTLASSYKFYNLMFFVTMFFDYNYIFVTTLYMTIYSSNKIVNKLFPVT